MKRTEATNEILDQAKEDFEERKGMSPDKLDKIQDCVIEDKED